MKARIEGGNLVFIRRNRSDNRIAEQSNELQIVHRRRSGPVWVALIVLAIILVPLTALLLRQNNLNMVELRNQLVETDKTGDVAQVESAARKLQNYVAHHMNTATGRVALQTLYDQAADQAMEASKPPEISSDIYQQATNDCRPQLVNYGYRAWASCVATRVGLNSATTLAVADDVAPDPDLYYVDFAPARWSADPAGLCMLALIIILLVLIVKLLLAIISKLYYTCKKHANQNIYRG